MKFSAVASPPRHTHKSGGLQNSRSAVAKRASERARARCSGAGVTLLHLRKIPRIQDKSPRGLILARHFESSFPGTVGSPSLTYTNPLRTWFPVSISISFFFPPKVSLACEKKKRKKIKERVVPPRCSQRAAALEGFLCCGCRGITRLLRAAFACTDALGRALCLYKLVCSDHPKAVHS